MFRNQYDSDNVTWSPQGRLFQLEYACEAVKQGSCCVGVRSKKHAVLVTLKRSPSELGSYQQKIFGVDEHIAMAISGLCGDGRVVSRFLRTEAISYKYTFGSPIPVERLVNKLSNKAQLHIQEAGRRPYGVGLLVIGYDSNGPHLFETSPNANHYEYVGHAIGARSQSARTYIEKVAQELDEAPLEKLIKIGVNALRESLQSNSSEEVNSQNCSIAVVGEDTPLKVYDGDDVQQFIEEDAQMEE